MLKTMMAALALLAATSSGAQALDRALLDCAAETDDDQRLACYDRAVARISSAAQRVIAERRAASERLAAERATAEAAAASKAAADAEAAKRQAFGGERLRRGLDDDGDIQTLTAAVVETLSDRDGMTVFVLDNGQMWRQTSGISLPPVRAGDKVELSRGAVGSYQMWLPRQKRSVKARRMR